MKIRYSRSRTFLFTFTLGLAILSIYTRSAGYLDEIPVNVPKVDSDTPIIIRLCPDLDPVGANKFYLDNGRIYFSKEKAVNCVLDMGSAGGGGGGSRPGRDGGG